MVDGRQTEGRRQGQDERETHVAPEERGLDAGGLFALVYTRSAERKMELLISSIRPPARDGAQTGEGAKPGSSSPG